MKIAFIASSLEPGRDGVGDYTRDLARECSAQGHSCSLIALHDRHLGESQTYEDGPLPTLRLSPAMGWLERIRRAEKFLAEHDPDWLSLQFVCFGFHDRGLVWDLASRIRSLAGERRTHIMFHELWIGGPHCEIKERLVSALQRHFVLKLCRGFGPSVVHTSNPVYVDLLNKHGLPARELPLFGAIPVVVRNADDWLFSRLREAGITVTAENRSQCWLFGIFGTLHPVWPPEPLFTKLKEAADLARRRIIIVSVGRIGAGQGLWNKMARDYSPGIHFLCLGEQPGERISEVFNSLDFGIATTPLALLGKSASAAAMFEHGLPVIVNRDEIHSLSDSRASSEDAKYVLRLDSSFVDRLVTAPIRRAPVSRLTAATERFLRSLTANQTWLCPA